MDTFLRIANDCLAYLQGVKWEDGFVTLGVCGVLAICSVVIAYSTWQGMRKLGVGAGKLWDGVFGPSVLARSILAVMDDEARVDEEKKSVTVPGRLHVGEWILSERAWKGQNLSYLDGSKFKDVDAIVVTRNGSYRILDDTHLSSKDRTRILARRDVLVKAARLARIAREKLDAFLHVKHGSPVDACADGACTVADCQRCEEMTAPKPTANATRAAKNTTARQLKACAGMVLLVGPSIRRQSYGPI